MPFPHPLPQQNSFCGNLRRMKIRVGRNAGKEIFMSEKNYSKTVFNTRTLVTLAILVAMEIVLSRFLSISAWNTKIGFSFIPVAVAAMLYGPVAGGLVGALGDFVGAVLFPIGAYFPGFTLTAFLTGVVFGLFLYREQTVPKIIGAVTVNQCVLSLCLNTLWISILYGSPYGPLFVTRIVQTVILFAVQTVTIIALAKVMPRIRTGLSAAS